jgi:hypothetical protein
MMNILPKLFWRRFSKESGKGKFDLLRMVEAKENLVPGIV